MQVNLHCRLVHPRHGAIQEERHVGVRHLYDGTGGGKLKAATFLALLPQINYMKDGLRKAIVLDR